MRTHNSRCASTLGGALCTHIPWRPTSGHCVCRAMRALLCAMFFKSLVCIVLAVAAKKLRGNSLEEFKFAQTGRPGAFASSAFARTVSARQQWSKRANSILFMFLRRKVCALSFCSCEARFVLSESCLVKYFFFCVLRFVLWLFRASAIRASFWKCTQSRWNSNDNAHNGRLG